MEVGACGSGYSVKQQSGQRAEYQGLGRHFHGVEMVDGGLPWRWVWGAEASLRCM